MEESNCLKTLKSILLISFLFSKLLSVAQIGVELPINNTPNYDTNYFRSYTDHLGLFTYALHKYKSYEIKNKETNTKLKFEPNGQTNLGIGFNYKFINLGIATSFAFMNTDNDVYGKTSRFDIQLNALSRFVGLSARYQKYNGFYLSNPQDFTKWNENYYPYISDLESTSIGISLFYILNHNKFSYKAAYLRNEVQKKNAGSFVLGAFCNIDVLHAPSGFIPSQLPDSLKQHFDFNGYSTNVTGIILGYSYSFIFFKRCFLNLSLLPGVGYRNLSIWYVSNNKKSDPTFTGLVSTRMSTGFDGKKFYFGISYFSNNESFKYESINISTYAGMVRFHVGKRFQVGKKKC